MSRLHLEFQGEQLVQNIPDGRDIDFSYDRKYFSEDYFDLKVFSTFFKLKEDRDFSIFPEEYSKYQDSLSRARAWIKTFKVTNVKIRDGKIYPSRLAQQFLRCKADLLISFHQWMSESSIYEPFLEYYTQHKKSFDVVGDMHYYLPTLEGEKLVDLVFAENFRFKPNKGTFSLATLKKEGRGIIRARENHFVYMADFSQFEFRTFLYLTDSKVDFSSQTIYEDIGEELGIQDPKIRLISNLYSEKEDLEIKKVVDKNKLVAKLSEEEIVLGQFPVYVGDSPKNKKIHTVIQTISYFYYLRKLAKVLQHIKDRESSFIFPLHDAMIFSISKDELFLVDEIVEILESEVYKVKSYIGKDLKEMERI